MGEEKFGKNGNQAGLFFCAQEISLAHEFAQKSSPFCKRANLSQEVSCCQNANSCKFILSSTEMDKENVPPPAQDSEASLEALLEEVAQMETVNVKTREEKTPWWLTEENLLGNVELDYAAENVPSTSALKEEKVIECSTLKDSKSAVLEEKVLIKEEATKEEKKAHKIKDTGIKIRTARIPRKEIAQQDHATEDATPLEGLLAGAGTGEKRNAVVEEEVREQSMGRCTVQMIRLVDNPPPPRTHKVEQLWWVTPETEEKVQNLIEGDDITQQWCAECGFKGTRKRVRIHCMQHHCKYVCECMLIKVSRDAIYDHQVSKGRAEEHGGAERRIYCVDQASYPALCSAMAWEDPPPFGEARPNRRGHLNKVSPTPDTVSAAPTRRSIMTRLGKQHPRPPPSPEKTVEGACPEPQPLSPGYRIPWTTEALLQKTRDCRHALGAGLKAQMALVTEALSQERDCPAELECQLHAELETMRQAYIRLSRD